MPSTQGLTPLLVDADKVLLIWQACASQQDQPQDARAKGVRPTRSAAKCPRPASPSPAAPELKLPGVSRKQALLLLHCLYRFRRDAWVAELGPPEMLELARIADRYGFLEVLDLVDNCLDDICEGEEDAAPDDAWLLVEDAPQLLQVACKLQLTRFKARVLRFIGRHVRNLDLSRLDNSMAAVLTGVRSVL